MPASKRHLWVALPVALAGVGVLAIVLWPRDSAKPAAGRGEWTCSMHPQIRRTELGTCPICGMNLIPVENLSSEQARVERTGGLETESIVHRELSKEVRTVGKLDYNEARVAYITARIAGRVDKVHADFTGIHVKPNDHLVDIYSPDLYVAQTELIRAVEASSAATRDKSFAERTLEASRVRLQLLGVLPEQITAIETSRKVQTHLTVYAPIGGTVIEKSIRPGQYVKEGDPLYRIADLDPIWLYLDIYESDLVWVRYGQLVDVALEAYPGERFRGTVVFIDPFLDDKTRTVRVRVNLKNPEGKLKPAMYATASIRARLRPDGTPEPTGLEGKYICPMHPEVVRDEPAKCPVCGMNLERVPLLGRSQPMAKTVHDHATHSGHEGHQKPPKEALPPGKVLAVRATAVLNTGRRTIAYKKRPDGAYEMVELTVGPLAEGKDDTGQTATYFPVLKGLNTGDQVVVRGGFLLDSQRQIEGMPSLLYPNGQGPAILHGGHGEAASAPSAHKH